MRRCIAENAKLHPGNMVQLSQEQSHHLATVLRRRKGNHVLVIDGRGSEAEAVIEKITQKEVALRILERREKNRAETGVLIEMALPLLKSSKIESVFRMATEMGVSRFYVYESDRCIPRKKNENSAAGLSRINRWSRIIRDSVLLSGRSVIPEISGPLHFKELIRDRVRKNVVLLPYEQEHSLLQSVMVEIMLEDIYKNKKKSICLITGPEGGFEPYEVDFAWECGAKICSLGTRILRAETAAVASLSTVLVTIGEM